MQNFPLTPSGRLLQVAQQVAFTLLWGPRSSAVPLVNTQTKSTSTVTSLISPRSKEASEIQRDLQPMESKVLWVFNSGVAAWADQARPLPRRAESARAPCWLSPGTGRGLERVRSGEVSRRPDADSERSGDSGPGHVHLVCDDAPPKHFQGKCSIGPVFLSGRWRLVCGCLRADSRCTYKPRSGKV